MPDIAFCGKSDIGLKRQNNEDVFIIKTQEDFCLVADGMGGASAGELASAIFAQTASDLSSVGTRASETEAVDLVRRIFKNANERILDHVKTTPSHEGMGCTAELLLFVNGGFVIGHVGDSRTYRFRNNSLKQLTTDHSLVQEQIDLGLISPVEARNHSMKNIILRAVGIKKELALDLIRGKTFPGDLFLLCSDGLTDMVDDGIIHEVMASQKPLEQKTDTLIELAKSAGGKDNITVVLAEVK